MISVMTRAERTLTSMVMNFLSDGEKHRDFEGERQSLTLIDQIGEFKWEREKSE